MCTKTAAYRVVILDREERLSTGLARAMQPTLCQACTQIAIDERMFREIVPIATADRMEQDFAKAAEAAEAARQRTAAKQQQQQPRGTP